MERNWLIGFAVVFVGAVVVGLVVPKSPSRRGNRAPASTAASYGFNVDNDLIIGRCYWFHAWLTATGKVRNVDGSEHDYELEVKWKFSDPLDLDNSKTETITVPAHNAGVFRSDSAYPMGDIGITHQFEDGDEVNCTVSVTTDP